MDETRDRAEAVHAAMLRSTDGWRAGIISNEAYEAMIVNGFAELPHNARRESDYEEFSAAGYRSLRRAEKKQRKAIGGRVKSLRGEE
jgi:hypothetical protein